MKKLLIAVLIMFILLANVEIKREFTLLDYFDGKYTSYTTTKQEGGIDLGFCHMNDTIVDNEFLIGESMTIRDLEVATAISDLNAKVIKTECLDDGTIVIYGYTKLIKDSVVVDNQKVNVQIAYKEEYSVIGWPLILGSF